MENYSIILLVLGIIILLTALAEKMNLSSPIFLIFAGLGLSFVKGLNPIHIEEDIIFLLFLPPLLFDAAFKIPQKEFKEHFSTISSLAFGLVFLTTLGIGALSKWLIPGMTWPLSFLLGAILAATDAVAAIGITKNLGLSHKTSVILEGESLLNDASALVAYRFALAAVMGSSFIWWKASISFLSLLFGGLVVGLIIAKLLGLVIKLVKNNGTAITSFILLSPFVTYLVAEELKVSGVIAVVVLGLSVAKKGKPKFTPKVKQQSESIWDVAIFLLNGLVFLLIGLELKNAILNLTLSDMVIYSVYALAITLAAILIRAWRVFLKRNALDHIVKKPIKNKRESKITSEMLIDAQESLIISLSGMRGIVSLAIAIAIPLKLDNGAPFSLRDTILFITFCVILYSIIGQGLLLPIILKRTQKQKMETQIPATANAE